MNAREHTKPSIPGLFITGTDTEIGKTYVGALIARQLFEQGVRVGVYKPAASGCEVRDGGLISQDAEALWIAAGKPGELEHVCPQRFLAPLAPHRAAEAEGKQLDTKLLRTGLEFWRTRSEFLLVEGAGGLLSPLGEKEVVADLAADFGFPLVIVAANRLGVINHVLQTLVVAETRGLRLAGIVLNDAAPPEKQDQSRATNRAEIEARTVVPILAEVTWGAGTATFGFDIVRFGFAAKSTDAPTASDPQSVPNRLA